MNLSLLPVTYEATIPEDYLDMMGHMNVMWYTHLFSLAVGGLYQRLGLTGEYFQTNAAGSFLLEAHVRHLSEVRAGQSVTIRTRMLGRSAKRLHFMNFMVKDDTVLAATSESVAAHIDMRIRRSSPFPSAIAEAIDQLVME